MSQYLMIDIGGSSIKYGLFNSDGELVYKSKIPAPDQSLEDFLNSLSNLICLYNVNGVGISMPGKIDSQGGIAHSGGVYTFIKDLPIVKLLESRTHQKVTIGNDAKVASLAEVAYGCLSEVNDAIVLIFGTGIGGCLIKDRKVIYGKNLTAGEFSFLIPNTKDLLDKDIWSLKAGSIGLLECVQEKLQINDFIDGEKIFELANAGNTEVLEALDQFTYGIAAMIYNLNCIYDPEKIAIGGGISQQEVFLKYIQKNLDLIADKFKDYCSPIKQPQIVSCNFYNDAALYGAYYQHTHSFDNEK